MVISWKGPAALVLFALLIALPAEADDVAVPAVGTEEADSTALPAALESLPPTSAGPPDATEIPLHFVPPSVRAFQEMDEESEEGVKVPQANLLPFKF